MLLYLFIKDFTAVLVCSDGRAATTKSTGAELKIALE